MYSIFDSETGKPLPIALTSVVDLNVDRWCDLEEAIRFCQWIPEEWSCDPCSQDRRFAVMHTAGLQYHYWFEVILVGYDDEKTMRLKLEYHRQVEMARQAVIDAQNTLRQLLN